MALRELLVNALNPYRGRLNTWSDEDIELLFTGFGAISIFIKDADLGKATDLSGTFKENAKAIDLALQDLGIHNGKWSPSDFYWIIDYNSGEPREDLIKAITDCGFNCYDWFDAEEMIEPKPIKTFSEKPLLY